MLKRDAAAAVGPLREGGGGGAGERGLSDPARGGPGRRQPVGPRRAELTKVTSSPGYQKADAWISLGQAQLWAKKYKDALASLDKAAAVAPNNMQIETFMAWSYFGLKDSKNFIDHGRKAKALGQKEPTLLGFLTRVEAGEAIK